MFRIEVKATISDGTPIERAIITCNTTQGVDISSVSSAALQSNANTTLNLNFNISELGADQAGFLKAMTINETEVNTRDPQALFSYLNSQLQTLNLSPNTIAILQRQYLNMFLANVDKQNLLYILGQGDIGLDTLSSLTKRTNVILVSVCGNSRTDSDGIATISLRFNAGTTGNYYIQCQSGQAYTPQSMAIQVNNSISQIKFVNPINQTISIPFLRSSSNTILPTYVPFPKSINISLMQSSSQQQYSGLIYDLQVKIIDYTSVNAAISKLNIDVSNFSLSEIQLINSFGQQTAVNDKMSRLWDIITTGANALVNSLGAEQSIQAINVNLTALPNYYQMNNLQIQLQQPGDYQLIISVNGIESQRSGVISVVDDPYVNKNPLAKYSSTVLIYIVYAFSLYLAFVNICKSPSFMSIIAILLVSFGITLVSLQGNYQSYFSIFMFITFGLMVINLAEMILIKCCGNEDERSHQYLKYKIFHEYTFQRLFHRPSANWVKTLKNSI